MSDEPSDQERGLSVSLIAVSPEQLDIKAISAAVAAAVAAVPEGVHLDVIVSGQYEETIRQEIADPDLSAAYTQDRVRGRAVAQVFDLGDHRHRIVADADLFWTGREPSEDPVRTLVHEALHVAIGERGETMTGRRARLGLVMGSAEGMFAGMAGQAVEEFRVERQLCQDGLPVDRAYDEQLVDLFADYRASLAAPATEWAVTGDDQALAVAALQGFEQAMTVVSYLLSADIASDGAQRPDLPAVGDPRWLASSYDALRDAFGDVPAAGEPVSRDRLDELADVIDAALTDWFAQIGFAVHDLPAGGAYLEVLDSGAFDQL